MSLHRLLDTHFGDDGLDQLRRLLDAGADPEQRKGPLRETALHVATRRRRNEAVEVLIAAGVDVDARTGGGKTAYAHALRRAFDETAGILRAAGADTALSMADLLAVALAHGDLDRARTMLRMNPSLARTGNPEEDRLLADLAGRPATEPVRMLIDAGADLAATGLDDGTPLHQAAWFGEPGNARSLIEAGAPLEIFDATHESSPLHWAVHGSRYSGDAAERQERYVEIVRMLLAAGAARHYPGDEGGDAYERRLLDDASEEVRALLEVSREDSAPPGGP